VKPTVRKIKGPALKVTGKTPKVVGKPVPKKMTPTKKKGSNSEPRLREYKGKNG
jgi:hypothetical protein